MFPWAAGMLLLFPGLPVSFFIHYDASLFFRVWFTTASNGVVWAVIFAAAALNNKRLRKHWPTVEGRIVSVAQDGSRSVLTYSFELGQDIFGGMTTIKSSPTMPYLASERVRIAYDPLNPDESKLIPPSPV